MELIIFCLDCTTKYKQKNYAFIPSIGSIYICPKCGERRVNMVLLNYDCIELSGISEEHYNEYTDKLGVDPDVSLPIDKAKYARGIDDPEKIKL